jgi:hypothetical protein
VLNFSVHPEKPVITAARGSAPAGMAALVPVTEKFLEKKFVAKNKNENPYLTAASK